MRLPPSARPLSQWLFLGGLVGVVSGVASALFLYLLDLATDFREQHTALVYTLPVAGLVLGGVYERWGKPIRGGNNLVLDSVHEGDVRLPLRMAPMVLLGTVLTHLFGGSAGREGTAVQMGGSLADAVARRLRVSAATRRELLAAGIAGGFGSVFGTPIAGTLFGLEVVVIGRMAWRWEARSSWRCGGGWARTRTWAWGCRRFCAPSWTRGCPWRPSRSSCSSPP